MLVYQSVLDGDVGQAFLALLQSLCQTGRHVANDHLDSLRAYGRWFNLLANHNQSWHDYLLNRILWDANPFTQQAQCAELASLPPALVNAARHDLQILQSLATCDSAQLSRWVQTATQMSSAPLRWEQPQEDWQLRTVKSAFAASTNWEDGLEALASLYRQHGVGLFAQYRAVRWQSGHFIGIANPDPVKVSDLVGYESQRDVLLRNTEFLLRGYPALHVLLYGSRGSGKSSLVKGLLQQYADQPLRLVEVAKSDLQDLPAIADHLRQQPQKFIIFVDDLSFEAEEGAYKALKVVLEGNLTAKSSNLVVYATSNRRHLIREFFADRPRPQDGDEVHAWDTVQEKLSFSDRFGLTLTFEPADQKTYLQIVHHLAHQAGITLPTAELDFRALQWATRHNGRSGRTARQFVDFLQADLALGQGNNW